MKMQNMKWILVSCLTMGAAIPAHAVKVANCRVDDKLQLYGNYNAVQSQAYEDSCVRAFRPSTKWSMTVVPIGNNGKGKESRISLRNGIRLQLFGAEDNTLADGKRGRQEVSTCYLTPKEFYRLSDEERAFREVAHDVYRGCAQRSPRDIELDVTLRFNDSPEAPYTKWDAIVAQFHAVDDKDLYCAPFSARDADTCNQNSGVLGRSIRNQWEYKQLVKEGVRFEGSVQPPLSFRFKDGFFSIVATSSLTDGLNQPSRYSPAAGCNVRVNSARVGETRRCADIGKTVTVLYREKLGQGYLRANETITFRVKVKWPAWEDKSSLVSVMVKLPDSAATYLVPDSTAPIGSFNDEYPYFKAGVYRQNGSAAPVSVDLIDLVKH